MTIHTEQAGMETAGWGLFLRFFLAQSGVLFSAAAVICFFAFNWAIIPAFGKFGIILLLMACAVTLPLRRDPDSSLGGLGLFAFCLFIGPLLAVYGQVYQTGADASDLFFTWALVILPAAVVAKRPGIWVLLWLIASIWVWQWQTQQFELRGLDKWYFYSFGFQITAQAVLLILWEVAALFAGPSRGFLYSRLLPRLIALTLLALMTYRVGDELFLHHIFRDAPALLPPLLLYSLYLPCMVAGAFWYTRRPDPVILSMGLFSLLCLFLVAFFSTEETWTIGGLSLGTALFLAGAAGAVKLLLRLRKRFQPYVEAWEQRRTEAAAFGEASLQARRTRKTASAKEPLLPSLFEWRALRFALTGRLTDHSTDRPADHRADHPADPLPSGKKHTDKTTSATAAGAENEAISPSGAMTAENGPAETNASDAELQALQGSREEAHTPAETTKEPAPWFIRLLIGLCAWIAAPLLLIIIGWFSTLILNGSDDSLKLISALSALLLVVAAFLSRRQGIFAEQFSLALGLAATATLGLSVYMDVFEHSTFRFVPGILACIFGMFLIRNALYRFLASACVACLFFFQVAFIHPEHSARQPFYIYNRGAQGLGPLGGLSSEAAPFNEISLIWATSFLFYFLICLIITHCFFTPRKHESTLLPPMRAGALIAVMLTAASLLPLMPREAYFFFNVGIGGGAALSLAWAAMRIMRSANPEQRPSLFVRLFFTVAAGLLSIIALFLPWLGAGIFGLILSRRDKSPLLIGFSVFYLIVCVNVEYYSLTLSLLHKSLLLGASGLLCLGAAFGTERLLTAGITAGRLPALRTFRAADAPAEAAPDAANHTSAPLPSQPLFERLRKPILAATAALFVISFVFSVHGKETILTKGTMMLLPLAPLDPRSLMQGDYMILDMTVERDVRQALLNKKPASDNANSPLKRRGTAIVRLDDTGAATFVRLADPEDIPAAGEYRLRYKGIDRPRVSSGTFFFQEGFGSAFGAARFAELRVNDEGVALITHLRDTDKKRIEPHLRQSKEPE